MPRITAAPSKDPQKKQAVEAEGKYVNQAAKQNTPQKSAPLSKKK